MKITRIVKIFAVAALCILFIVILCFVIITRYQRAVFFKNLEVSQIERIVLYSFRGGENGEKVELPEEEIPGLVALLNQVRITGGGSEEFKNLTGGGPYRMFRIELTDGRSFEFAAGSSHYIINGDIAYETEDYELSKEIYYTYYGLVDEYCDKTQ